MKLITFLLFSSRNTPFLRWYGRKLAKFLTAFAGFDH